MHAVCLRMCPGCRTQKHTESRAGLLLRTGNPISLSARELLSTVEWRRGAVLHFQPMLLPPPPSQGSPEAPPAWDRICFSYHSFFFPSSTSSLCPHWSSGRQQSKESNSSPQNQRCVPAGMVMAPQFPSLRALPQLRRQCWRRGRGV